jgi:hypothetical protein
MSRAIGILGTLLAGLAAGLSDFHAITTSSNVGVALTAIVGWLVGHHIVSSASARTAEKDVVATAHRVFDAFGSSLRAASPTAPDWQPPAG